MGAGPVSETARLHSVATLRYFLLEGRVRLEPLRVFESGGRRTAAAPARDAYSPSACFIRLPCV